MHANTIKHSFRQPLSLKSRSITNPNQILMSMQIRWRKEYHKEFSSSGQGVGDT